MKENRTVHFFTINRQLRFLLFGLECVLGVEFDAAASEQIFEHEHKFGVEARDCILYNRTGLRVVGSIEHHEPGTVRLIIDDHKDHGRMLADIAERARYQVLRMERSEEMCRPCMEIEDDY